MHPYVILEHFHRLQSPTNDIYIYAVAGLLKLEIKISHSAHSMCYFHIVILRFCLQWFVTVHVVCAWSLCS